MNELTPMMQQYIEMKSQYKDCILFYRLGDFYEMFFEDALIASKELEITLTGRNCGQEERAPMCGVPFHAVDGYLSKLVSRGYKVAICEQVEDPKLAKGLVKREVIRIVTPGTNLNTQVLDEDKNNYLMGIFMMDDAAGIAAVDVTTGDFYLTEVDSTKRLYDEIYKFMPSEIVCNNSFLMNTLGITELKERQNIVIQALEERYFDYEHCTNALYKHFSVVSLDALGLADYTTGVIAAGTVMQYLNETQKTSLTHLTSIKPYVTGNYMIIDSSTRRNLELVETMRDKTKKGSLLGIMDRTKTAMGARQLRQFIEEPLVDMDEINDRLDAIQALNDNLISREELREYLGPIYDLERLMGKVSYGSANPRDLIALQSSLSMLPHIRTLLGDFSCKLLRSLYEGLDTLSDIASDIEAAIEPDPPINVREGNIIRSGYNADVDSLRNAKTEGKTWLAELEAKERDRTGIKNLRIKFNRVFGYYLEVTNSYKELVPEEWIRKQTLANAERYTTMELKELEDKILNAEDRLYGLEFDLFCELRNKISENTGRVQKTAKAIALIDAFASMAYVAEKNRYSRPALNKEGIIDIKNGRHPVVECMMREDSFVANDTYLDNNSKRIAIITGPNMAGKSTYMRQVALITLMAQIGSFVPAETANIGLVDRIFTRVGASDDLASGQSTFMVEMTEVANILRNATCKSLLILDEIGRGTSTFDGLGIAWAVVEYISNTKLLGAKTLFATHYHELTELEGKLDSVSNYCVAVRENGDDIIFLRKIVQGGADKSYGIQVAKLAGVPDQVLARAREIVEVLTANDIGSKAKVSMIELHEMAAVNAEKATARQKKKSDVEINQLSLFGTAGYEDIVDEIRNMDLSKLTPIDALNHLYSIQTRIKHEM